MTGAAIDLQAIAQKDPFRSAELTTTIDLRQEAVDDTSVSVKSIEKDTYEFSPSAAAISAGTAIGVWLLINGVVRSITHSWSVPLAVILGLALLPVAVLGGLRHRA